jgi:XTP/dITP diphosphohydrolase
MNEIIFGTTNLAKVAHVQSALDSLEIKVRSIGEFGNFPDLKEDGKTPQENSRKKAIFYSSQINRPVLSMDIALYFDGVPDEKQPGLNVRRIPGFTKRPTDEELIGYYSKLIKKYGGEIHGHWDFAMCLALPDGTIKEITAFSKDRYFTSKICSKRMAGYPLASLQFDKKSNMYIAEMDGEEPDDFWQDSIGKELRELLIK